ncbi:MAG: RIP metalloprotease RseP [Rhodobacteraceae bacterium]|nr:RIP metalloprotease RseP [Paracoccaceae bacterium]
MDILGLIPSFGGLLFTLAAFVIALSVIVAIHEYGHYIVGRWSGIHAEVFSLGFGPVLYSRVDKRGTKWQFAALPLGGFVRFKGDANATSAPDGSVVSGLTPDEERMTMQGAPLWARAATVAAGPLFNFILSIIVFGALIMFRGVASDPLTVEAIEPLPFEQVGLEVGDEILSIAGIPLGEEEGFGDVTVQLPREAVLDYEVIRDGQTITVPSLHPMTPLIINLQPRSAAIDIDLEVGDVITAIEGQEIFLFSELRDAVGASDGKPLKLDVWREGEMLEFVLTPRRVDLPLPEGGFETRWLIGISGGAYFSAATVTPGPIQAVTYGVEQMWFIMRGSLSALYNVAVGAISSCNLSGPIGIAEVSGDVASQGLVDFIWFIAVLSTAVGLINLFPIPILDGGHLVFHAWEAVAGKPPSDGAMKWLMYGGLTVVLSFMLFAISNDILCP